MNDSGSTITQDELKVHHLALSEQDVFYQAELKLRALRDSGGGQALATLIVALHQDWQKNFNFSTLCRLDSESRHLAVSLVREYLLGNRRHDEWESLAELAQRCAFE